MTTRKTIEGVLIGLMMAVIVSSQSYGFDDPNHIRVGPSQPVEIQLQT